MTKRDEKIQGYIFKNLLKDTGKVFYSEYGRDSVAVTWDGHELYVLPKEYICFSLDKCKESPDLRRNLDKHTDDKELTLTDTLIQIEKDYCRKLKAKNFDIWVNDKLLKDFSKAKYYAYKPLGRVIAVDSKTCKIIGCVLPTKVKDKN